MLPLNISGSALSSLQKAQANSANNVANALTPGFQSNEAVFQVVESGGVSLQLRQNSEQVRDQNNDTGFDDQPSDTDQAEEAANQLIYKQSFKANAAVLKSADETLGSVIDILA